MKRYLAFLFAFILLAASLTICGTRVYADDADDGENNDELPSFCTLVGSPDLPPIGNQGEVGCCASMSITYMQFTNAVSKYLRENDPEHAIKPSTGKSQYIFSPKWTYSFAGAGTAWVYDVLCSSGCVTMDKSSYNINRSNNFSFMFHKRNRPSEPDPNAIKWDIEEGQMEEALRYRLSGYEQIWINNSYAVNGGISITSSEKGQQLLEKIKRSLLDGNVVVTGGFSGAWQYVDSLTDVGNLAASKKEHALVCSLGAKAGGHQLSIVGYDDNVSCKYKNVTLRGAFLVANSWGTTWMNRGYVWLMYDALNEISDYEKLNAEDRIISMDQFCFTDWRKDVALGTPRLYLEATVEAKNREAVSVRPLRLELSSSIKKTTVPYLYTYARNHPTYDLTQNGEYISFAGEINGESSRAVFSFAYDSLLELNGKSFSDFSFGALITASEKNARIYSLKLKNEKGEVISEVALPEEGKELSGALYLYFPNTLSALSFGQDLPEGIVPGDVDAIYAAGTEVEVPFTVLEGYDASALSLKVNGEALTKNADGKYIVKLNNDAVLSFEGVKSPKEDQPDTPPDDDPGHKDAEKEKETDNQAKKDDGSAKVSKSLVKTAVIVAAASVAVLLVATAIVVPILILRRRR